MSIPQPDLGDVRRQFEDEVFPTELGYIEDRRRSVGDSRDRPLNRNEPGIGNDLVGLALSGGGIRSASFSLGFLQALGSRLFRRIDYLSTVSGGGFIGSSISARMADAFYRDRPTSEAAVEEAGGRAAADVGPEGESATRASVAPPAFPFPLTRHDEEPPALSHLRSNSNYMTPAGLGDVFRFVAVLLRGIILNSLALFPFLLLTCLFVLLVYGQQLSDRARFDDQARRIDGLLDRYLGDRLDSQREVEPLLGVLEGEALLRIDEGKTRGDVIGQLRPALSFGRDPPSALITGSGTEASPYRLTPDASREDLARALLEGDLLQRYEVIEEVDLLARALEQNGYRHCDGATGEDGASEEVDCDDSKYRDELSRAAHQGRLIRPGTDEDLLDEFLKRHWSPLLKPVLQALYNGEYLDSEIVRGLVVEAEELDRQSPYYAYGWYEARVGEPFNRDYGEDSWYTTEGKPWPGEAEAFENEIRLELERLVTAFGRRCLGGAGEVVPTCLRPRTTPDDVRRLLEFEGVIVADDITDLVEVLYFGEYLDEHWVRETLRDAAPSTEWQRLAERVDDFDDSYAIYDSYGDLWLPALKPETVCADLAEVLLDQGLIEDPECPYFKDFDVETLSQGFEAVWDLLDERWVHRQLYVYHYGWHRSLIGKPYPGSWCGGAAASRGGGGGCPEASDEAWGELSRALRDPSQWDPNRLGLPLSSIVVRVALGWVLLLPLLLVGARLIYDGRHRAVAQEFNPLRALLSSDQSLNWRALYEWTFGLMLTVILAVGLFELLPYAVHHFHYLNLRGQSSRTLAVGVVSLLATVLGGPALAFFQRFGRTVVLVSLAVAGPALLLTVFVYAMEYAVYSPPPQVDGLLKFIAEPSAMFGPVSDDATAPDQVGQGATLWFLEGGRRLLNPAAAWVLFAIALFLSIGLALLIDINATSLHGLYRDRISKAFMVGLDVEGSIEPEEDLALHHICPSGSGAPYHLLNVALNLQGSADRSLRGRSADFLYFSRDHIGGPRTGFCRTRDMAWLFPHVHLGSATAVSGAAVSPNMGRFKSGPLAVLMSLLNIRLALWMPHPGAVRKWFAGRGDPAPRPRPLTDKLWDGWRRLRMRAPATLLLRELTGTIHARGPVINVSDGGHIENTGALELLRRRCREVIIVDGEADPSMAFGGLALLQRIARIEMGIEIDVDLDALRPDDHGLSRRRSAVGVIRYPARTGGGQGQDLVEETGRLLYVKLAVTGTEGQTVAEYRARNKAFPHESTGDQAFDEGQFEAYRRLGQLAGNEVFGVEEGCQPGPILE